MHSGLVLTFLALFVSVVVSTKPPSGSNCKKSEFWWNDKKCCLPVGGPPKPPSPPKGSNCPPTNYYWNNDRGCCTPRNPPPSNPPPPQCPQGWSWEPLLWRCTPTPTPPSPPPSHPSPKPPGKNDEKDCDDDKKNNGNKGHDNGPKNNNKYHRRTVPKSRTSLCPSGFDACAVSGALDGDYECVDFATELEFCGGCPSLGRGQDCSKIEGAWNVGCEQGSCVVYTCAGGYELGADGKSCVLA